VKLQSSERIFCCLLLLPLLLSGIAAAALTWSRGVLMVSVSLLATLGLAALSYYVLALLSLLIAPRQHRPQFAAVALCILSAALGLALAMPWST
jgi:hypothetical protein